MDRQLAADRGQLMAPLSYLEFLLVFFVPPIVLFGVVAAVRENSWWGWRPVSGLAVIIAIAVVYTTPWDNLLIAAGVWQYGEGTTLVHFWEAPLGEYLFFVLQPILTALWLFQFPKIADMSLRVGAKRRLLGVVAGLAVSAIGYLLVGTQSTFYLGAILLWSGPILAIQWGFGWPYLWEIRRTFAIALAAPTLYYWAIDRFAIETGLWTISSSQTTGLAIFGLPVEEAVFFLMTNIFAIQGLVMYMWLFDRVDRGELEAWTVAVRNWTPSTGVEG
jgi:lycopene cyclase domain-containing protein